MGERGFTVVDINLKSITISNFFQFGANLNIFNFLGGMTWIKAVNGTGKSTVVDAISFALFNKLYRNITLFDAVNSTNNEDSKVTLEFDRVRSDGHIDSYTLIRTIKLKGLKASSSFKLYREGESNAVAKTQKNLEDEILGFNKVIFDNVICLDALTTNFLETAPDVKRKLMESIASLDVSKIQKRNAKETTNTKTQLEIAKTSYITYKTQVDELSGLVDNLKKEQLDNIDKLVNSLGQYEKEIEAKKVLISEFDVKIKEVIGNGKSLKESSDLIGDVDSQIDELNSLSPITTTIKNTEEEIKLITETLEKQNIELILAEKNLTTLNSTKTEYESVLSKYPSNNPLIEKNNIDNNINTLTKAMDTCKSKNENIKLECPTCNKAIDNTEIETIRNQYRSEWVEHNNSLKEAKQALLDISIDIELYPKYESLKTDISNKSNDISNIKSSILSSNQSINTHTSTIDTNKLKLVELEGKYDINNISDVLDGLKTSKIHKSEITIQLSDLRVKLSELNGDISILENDIKSIDANKVKDNNELTRLQSISEDDSLGKATTQLEKATKAVSESELAIKKESDKLEILKHIAELCSDDGVKKDLLSGFIPMLNHQILKFLRLFNQPYTVEFMDNFDYKFISDMGSSKVYNALSAGQKSRVNFAISIAFRSFVAQIGDFWINIMFLDEFLDKSTDSNGINTMVKILKSQGNMFGNINVMTHKGDEFNEEWDNVIEIDSDGTFSTIASH